MHARLIVSSIYRSVTRPKIRLSSGFAARYPSETTITSALSCEKYKVKGVATRSKLHPRVRTHSALQGSKKINVAGAALQVVVEGR